MKQKDYILNLFETIAILDNAIHWLKRSYTICSGIGLKESYTEEEFAPKEGTKINCPECGTFIDIEATYCLECGWQLIDEDIEDQYLD